MGASTKNIAGLLLLVTVAFGGYYFYSQNKSGETSEGTAILSEELLMNTQVFIERKEILSRTKVDTTIFTDPVFRSYKSFSTPVKDEKTGRENPFGRITI
jgi:hypothetical protein